MVAALRHRAASHGDRTAFLFLRDNDPAKDLDTMSYAALDTRARAIATALRRHCRPGDRVLLLQQPGPAFVAAYYGALYAGTIAVTTYPAHRTRLKHALPKLRDLLADADCATVLTTADVAPSFSDGWRQLFGDAGPTVLASDTIATSDADGWQDPAASHDTVAFLQYTSGSTSRPRGVTVTHGNLLHNVGVIARKFEVDADSVSASWLPPYHDMGLIGGVVTPLAIGIPTVILSPYTFLQHPVRWLQTITKVRATVTGGPNFAYDLCVRRVTPEQLTSLDLSSWRVSFTGAEPIHAETLERFSAMFSSCGFNPKTFYACYGLAESTLMVSGGEVLAGPTVAWLDRSELEAGRALVCDPRHEGARPVVGCGTASPDQRVFIVDPATRVACADGAVGEVWVSGPSVASGYWRRPDETAHTFAARRADTGEGPFLRTGDLGVLIDGELFITGRIKDLIIISGRNLYPHDLELVAQASHPGLQPFASAAFSHVFDGAERLVLVQEVHRDHLRGDADAMIAAIREALMRDAEVQPSAIVLLKPGQIPRTSSGKVRRSWCRSLLFDGALETVAIAPEPAHPFWAARLVG